MGSIAVSSAVGASMEVPVIQPGGIRSVTWHWTERDSSIRLDGLKK